MGHGQLGTERTRYYLERLGSPQEGHFEKTTCQSEKDSGRGCDGRTLNGQMPRTDKAGSNQKKASARWNVLGTSCGSSGQRCNVSQQSQKRPWILGNRTGQNPGWTKRQCEQYSCSNCQQQHSWGWTEIQLAPRSGRNRLTPRLRDLEGHLTIIAVMTHWGLLS